MLGSTGSGAPPWRRARRTLPGVSAPSSVVRSIIRTIRSRASSFDRRLIERFGEVGGPSSSATASTPPIRVTRGSNGSKGATRPAGDVACSMRRIVEHGRSGRASGILPPLVVGSPRFVTTHLGRKSEAPTYPRARGAGHGPAVALLASACGGGGSGSSTPAAGSSGGGKVVKIGLVTDIGGLNDQSFNHLAFVGTAAREVAARHRRSRSCSRTQDSDYVPNLQHAAPPPTTTS